MTIIGVSDEPPAKIEPYLKANKVEYLIASGGGQGYKTRGIPHAWLVAPDGNVVWEGHPGNLKEGQIEEQLKNVRLGPAFGDLPEKAKRARKYLEAGKFAKGVKALQKLVNDPEAGAAAKEAIEKIAAMGEGRLERVEKLAEAGAYGEAIAMLEAIEKQFKGLDAGDKAKAKRKAWKKDKRVKAELDGVKILRKAKALIKANRHRDAARLLLAMTKKKKFAGTRCCDKAKELLKGLEAYY